MNNFKIFYSILLFSTTICLVASSSRNTGSPSSVTQFSFHSGSYYAQDRTEFIADRIDTFLKNPSIRMIYQSLLDKNQKEALEKLHTDLKSYQALVIDNVSYEKRKNLETIITGYKNNRHKVQAIIVSEQFEGLQGSADCFVQDPELPSKQSFLYFLNS